MRCNRLIIAVSCYKVINVFYCDFYVVGAELEFFFLDSLLLYNICIIAQWENWVFSCGKDHLAHGLDVSIGVLHFLFNCALCFVETRHISSLRNTLYIIYTARPCVCMCVYNYWVSGLKFFKKNFLNKYFRALDIIYDSKFQPYTHAFRNIQHIHIATAQR